MKQFAVGDRVETIDDMVSGRVVDISPEIVLIETDEGFQMQFPPNALMKTSDAPPLEVTNYEAALAKKEKQQPKKSSPKVKRKERNAPKMEVDLHIHQLTNSTKGMSNFDMLNLQLDTAKNRLEFAIRNRIQKVVFVHGVGEGVLKEELNYLFGRYDNLTYYDADYKKYGLGATEVYIYQNP
ncbi:Smr/MutS family protein [Poritiphilus flavus]|uniref:DNA mismatch repair protein MutS n=1 Tax=Poritiphilus flavus TaxID=2697053 RepID=A0A6L9E9W4_9FLAO|nr:Smr/MutS family protein [Poritiphilus flavus]NAS11352.1 DNA mismatch repair protein MutS [Poritiphilus flavus]